MIKNLRDNDFRRRCVEVYGELERQGRRPTLREVVETAIASPAPNFYVAPGYAYNKLLRMLRHGEITAGATPRERMWLEMAELVRAERLRRGCTVARALGTVLNFRRPSGFFLSTEEGLRIARSAFEGRVVHRPRRTSGTNIKSLV